MRNHQYCHPENIWADNVIERPLDPRARFNLGYSLDQSGNHAAAAVQYAKALELAPDYYTAADALGRALVESGDLRAAENFYTREIRLFPAFSGEAHRQRGWLRAERGDASGARRISTPSRAQRKFAMSHENSDSRRGRWIAPLLVISVGAIAYSNSFKGPFIFDDGTAVL